MKPCDLTESNWDVRYAVFAGAGFEARVTADARQMWFRVSAKTICADVTIPIREFRKAAKYVEAFDLKTLTDANPFAGKNLGTYCFEITDRVGIRKRSGTVMKKIHPVILFRPWRQYRNHSFQIRLSEFRKIIQWYHTDWE
ncbi:MAG TPA: hypothetical protein VFW94_24140 [Candidatus Acidoferrales bacterium]|nr:hypothetical protein [Candidatus Acidoferrales bacterium]